MQQSLMREEEGVLSTSEVVEGEVSYGLGNMNVPNATVTAEDLLPRWAEVERESSSLMTHVATSGDTERVYSVRG